MYLDFLVKVPTVHGKITQRKKKNAVYVEYEYDRIYDPARQYTFPKRATIGKLLEGDSELMQPNQNFLKYFPDVELPEMEDRTSRSSCLRVGTYFVLRKIMEEYNLKEILGEYFQECNLNLFLDLAVYAIITENNAAQYYSDYTYNHPLFTDGMKQYSNTVVSAFLNAITDAQSIAFLNAWNKTRNHRGKIYISYDSTNKNCQAGDIEITEFGQSRVNMGQPVSNYVVAYDIHNREPLFYEKYPDNLNDISQLQFILDKAFGYGYKKIGFVLDRGCFSRENIQYMDKCGYSFIIMVKGTSSLVDELILEHKGNFECKSANNIYEYGVYGKTVKRRLYVDDKKERYFHLYCEENTQAFVLPEERCSVVESELELAGYFCIVTSEKMSAKDAIELYKSCDTSEKLFCGNKAYLENKNICVYSKEPVRAKIFVEFVAMIMRCKVYKNLKEEMKNLKKQPNYITVPAALKELEKIEMVRQLDNVYRLDHAVTEKQKVILNAFGMDANQIKYYASELSEELKKAK
ncbi:MAG: transposase [Thomasclavelia ramosa]